MCNEVSVLFSEPKIPQCRTNVLRRSATGSFSALQRAENSSIRYRVVNTFDDAFVSVLFSEPKIPQYIPSVATGQVLPEFQCSSASRKFLNEYAAYAEETLEFQCSSASRKFLNLTTCMTIWYPSRCFSALQRAENSSIVRPDATDTDDREFQCSSASRKFLNRPVAKPPRKRISFQCSSASRKFLNAAALRNVSNAQLTFQCSSASRKFLNDARTTSRKVAQHVSVLFSEPKIPQSSMCSISGALALGFQCSSASRKFLNL